MKPKILITGGAGYIGSHTALFLYQKGFDILIIDDFSQEQKFKHSWANVIKSDFSDEKVLNNIFKKNKIEAVMHFAASIEVSQSIKSPLDFYNNNVSKTIKLLNAMVKNGIKKIIFSSSCAVYGNPEYLPLNEEHPTKPINPYGRCKLIIEEILKDLNNAYGLNYVSLRYFNAAGALPEFSLGEQHKTESHLIPLLIKHSNLNLPFNIYGTDYPTKDGTCIRDFIHVMDIAQAHWLALKHLNDNNPSDFFNLGTGQGFSIKEIINSFENIYNVKLNVINSKKREGDAPILVADYAKAKNILKWSPHNSNLENILRSAYIFEKNRFLI